MPRQKASILTGGSIRQKELSGCQSPGPWSWFYRNRKIRRLPGPIWWRERRRPPKFRRRPPTNTNSNDGAFLLAGCAADCDERRSRRGETVHSAGDRCLLQLAAVIDVRQRGDLAGLRHSAPPD